MVSSAGGCCTRSRHEHKSYKPHAGATVARTCNDLDTAFGRSNSICRYTEPCIDAGPPSLTVIPSRLHCARARCLGLHGAHQPAVVCSQQAHNVVLLFQNTRQCGCLHQELCHIIPARPQRLPVLQQKTADYTLAQYTRERLAYKSSPCVHSTQESA